MALIAAFFATALLYASVGFGGGSTYNALLALSDIDYRLMPAIALSCNIIVVAGGTWRFARAGFVPWRRVLPLVLISAPLAWLGGLTQIKEVMFLTLLAISLIVAGAALLFQSDNVMESPQSRDRQARMRDLLSAAGLGYLAGLVGIGGGIFLAPYLHFTRWAQSKEIAATASVFILINSAAGLVGQMLKLVGTSQFPVLVSYWPLAISVFVGGQIGSHLGITMLSARFVRRATAVLILYVAGQLLWKLATI
jgi:uncharacterized protein